MTREAIETHIEKLYGCAPDYPWMQYPGYAVYRHADTRKWFAVMMHLPKRKFGIEKDGGVDVMNVKCDTVLLSGLLAKPGFFPAYHMHKGKWISVLLDGSVEDGQVQGLIDISFNLTKKKER